MKPMLAKKYAKGKLTFPCFVQPKLNGIRGLYIGPQVMQSRSYGQEEGLIWHPPVIQHVLDQLKDIVWPLDGEFYKHGWHLQEINSAISVIRTEPNAKSCDVEYHVFDIIAPLPFVERAERLKQLRELVKPPVFVVDTIYCHSEEFGDQCYNHFKSLKYEGMIYRDYSARYGREFDCPNQENRWSCLLKRKERLDLEGEIIDVLPSLAERDIPEDHIGSLQIRWQGKIFSGGGGLSNEQKIRYFHSPPIGKIARVTYDSLSKDGIPLQTSTELVYE